MSPKDFRKIYHLEPKILNSLVNLSQTHAQTDRRTSVNLELTPPEVSQLKSEREGHFLTIKYKNCKNSNSKKK